MDEEQYLLGAGDRNPSSRNDSYSEEDDDDDWSGDSSDDCSSYYSDTDSSIPEWESYVEESGRLLFIDCHPSATQPNADPEPKSRNPLAKTQARKSTRGKFLRLIRRRDSKRRSRRPQKSNEPPQENKVTFHDCDDGEVRHVVLKLDGNVRRKFGRRAKLAESTLGISVGTFPDGSRVMVAGFAPTGDAKNDRNVKIGDWLRAVNDVPVTAGNLTETLEGLQGDEVRLELQRVTGVEVTKQPGNGSSFVRGLIDALPVDNELLLEHPVGVLYIDTTALTENGPEFEGVLYCYPSPIERNCLCTCRGVFITVNDLMAKITSSSPQITSVLHKGRLAHVVYNVFGGKLLLFMLPDYGNTAREIAMSNDELLCLLRFTYDTVDKCFGTENKEELDRFFGLYFARVLGGGLWGVHLGNTVTETAPRKFEELLPAAQYLALPVEARMQIDDALSELEACDYREWNEDPLDCQRLFTILGSALYHSGYLLASHLIHKDLVDVHVFCRQQGFFHLSRTEPVKCLVLWREVFPNSCRTALPTDSRRYLLIVGGGSDLLATIMEAGGCTEPAEDNLGPDAFYVEEAQATLAHLQELGISELADRWMRSNPGSQVTIPQLPTVKRKSDFLVNLNFAKSASPTKENSPQNKKPPEVTSILKRRSSDQTPAVSQSGSVFSIPDDAELQSEDSVSQGGYSERSEISDEPVLGRRALRERTRGNFDDSDNDDSDIDDYRDGSQISNSSYDLNELRQALLNETGVAQPVQLTAGNEVVLFHYVQLDFTEGILLSPPQCRKDSKILNLVLENFRDACQNIHRIFRNTLRFKNMPPQDMAKSVMNKSLIAIKEYGSLFEIDYQDDTLKKPVKMSYWIIGRLFYMPHPRELYVCYQDTIPQNLTEMAFKLGLSMSI